MWKKELHKQQRYLTVKQNPFKYLREIQKVCSECRINVSKLFHLVKAEKELSSSLAQSYKVLFQ